MVKAYSYARFSRRSQAEGDSLRRQLSAAYAYAEASGLELDTTLQDHGVSAYTGDNRTKGALKSFLDRVEFGEIERGSFLLIDSMDRLSREMVTTATHQLLGIALAGITVVTLSDGRKFDRNASMADVMMAVIEIERSHRESAEKSRKVREAHGESKRKAREEGRVWHRAGPTWLAYNEATKKFDPITAKVAVVQRMFDLVEQGLGTTAIAKQFNAEGVEPPKGGDGGWHHTAILETLKNPAVIGQYQPRLAVGGRRGVRRPADGEPVENYYPAVIGREQFYKVQAIIKSRSPKRGNSSNAFANLFTGLCVCNACGGTVGLHSAPAHNRWKRSSALQCVDSRRGRCVAKRRFKYEAIEAAVLKHVREFVPPSERRDDPLAAKVAVLEAERDETARKVENLLALLEDGDSGLMDRYRQRKTELAAKEAELSELREERKTRGVVAVPFSTRQEALQRLMDRMGAAEGKELYRLRASISAALKGVIAEMEFFGKPDETTEGGMLVREDYVTIRMVDDERTYMLDDMTITVMGQNQGAVSGEKIWFDPEDKERLFG